MVGREVLVVICCRARAKSRKLAIIFVKKLSSNNLSPDFEEKIDDYDHLPVNVLIS